MRHGSDNALKHSCFSRTKHIRWIVAVLCSLSLCFNVLLGTVLLEKRLSGLVTSHGGSGTGCVDSNAACSTGMCLHTEVGTFARQISAPESYALYARENMCQR